MVVVVEVLVAMGAVVSTGEAVVAGVTSKVVVGG